MSFPIETLPDETLLNMFEFLEFKDLGRCLQVSKRFRKMALDETLWKKIKTVDQDVSAEFLIQALTHGTKHLSLESTSLPLYKMPRDQEIDLENLKFHVIYTFSRGGMDSLEFPVQNRLTTLNLEIGAAQMILSGLFDSCQGLEKLYLTRFSQLEELKPVLSCIASNGRSLKILNFGGIRLGLNGVKIICDNCMELKEFSVVLGTSEAVSYFCENLTTDIRKLNIFSIRSERFSEPANFNVNRIQFEKLTKRCNELIALSILGTTMSIKGVSNIMKNLSQSLEKFKFALPTHTWHFEQGLLHRLPILLDLQGFEFQPMPKLTEVCFHQLDLSLIPKIQQLFHRKLPFVTTVFSDDVFEYYDGTGIAVFEK